MCFEGNVKKINKQLNKQKNRKTHTQMYRLTKGKMDRLAGLVLLSTNVF
jgi:hypothetical protein